MSRFEDEIFKLFLRLIQYPGIIVCKLVNKLVYKLIGRGKDDLRYIGDSDELDYDSDEKPIDLGRGIYLTAMSFFINNIVGVGLMGLSKKNHDSKAILSYFLLWISLSILARSFSNMKILRSIWNYIKEPGRSITTRILTLPILGILCLGRFLSYDLLGLAYAAGMNYFLKILF